MDPHVCTEWLYKITNATVAQDQYYIIIIVSTLT
jgi:hypothetical protein